MTLYEILKDAMEANGDSFENRVCKLSDAELRGVGRVWNYFDGFPKLEEFLCWGENFVYTIVNEERQGGGEDVLVSFPRNPDFK